MYMYPLLHVHVFRYQFHHIWLLLLLELLNQGGCGLFICLACIDHMIYRRVGPRSHVWSEKEFVDKAAEEFNGVIMTGSSPLMWVEFTIN